MELVETPIFTAVVTKFIDDERYRDFQNELILNPVAGRLVPNSGGLRKVRMTFDGSGKSGGARVLYLYLKSPNVIYLLLIYKKSNQANLNPAQLKQLRELAMRIKAVYRNEEK